MCGFRFTVGDGYPDVDGDGGIGCPICFAVAMDDKPKCSQCGKARESMVKDAYTDGRICKECLEEIQKWIKERRIAD